MTYTSSSPAPWTNVLTWTAVPAGAAALMAAASLHNEFALAAFAGLAGTLLFLAARLCFRPGPAAPAIAAFVLSFYALLMPKVSGGAVGVFLPALLFGALLSASRTRPALVLFTSIVSVALFALLLSVADNGSHTTEIFTFANVQQEATAAGIFYVVMAILYTCSGHSMRAERAHAEAEAKAAELERVMERNISLAKAIAQGNLDNDLKACDSDTLSEALFSMRENLRISANREQREKYVHTGLTELSQILRQNNTSQEEICNRVMSFLVKHLNVNQGALFVSKGTGEEVTLRLAACFAYNRKKYLNREINPGEGLVGQCYLERSRIYLREVPKDYISITSGLGEALPKVVVLTPLRTDDTVEGVVEVASFNDLEEYKLEFLDKAAEAISASLYSGKISENTNRLYLEMTQQAEQLRAQEEEMRQNLEELTATQEEIRRNSLEMEGRIEGINRSGIAFLELSPQGRITAANANFLATMHFREDALIGKLHHVLVKEEQRDHEQYAAFTRSLAAGESVAGEFERIDGRGQVRYLRAGYSPIRDVAGNITKIIMFCIDLTEIKAKNDLLREQEEELRQQMEEMRATQDELSRKNEEAVLREAQLQQLMEEMKANELDLQRIEAKYKNLTREYLLLQKKSLLKSA